MKYTTTGIIPGSSCCGFTLPGLKGGSHDWWMKVMFMSYTDFARGWDQYWIPYDWVNGNPHMYNIFSYQGNITIYGSGTIGTRQICIKLRHPIL